MALKKKHTQQQQTQIQSITKTSVMGFLNKQEEFLTEQKSIHISKRAGNQNLVYLNAQRDFIIKMRESLHIE